MSSQQIEFGVSVKISFQFSCRGLLWILEIDESLTYRILAISSKWVSISLLEFLLGATHELTTFGPCINLINVPKSPLIDKSCHPAPTLSHVWTGNLLLVTKFRFILN